LLLLLQRRFSITYLPCFYSGDRFVVVVAGADVGRAIAVVRIVRVFAMASVDLAASAFVDSRATEAGFLGGQTKNSRAEFVAP
jgi:hypothetical protein